MMINIQYAMINCH